MAKGKINISKVLGGKALWPTIYVLVYTFYIVAFSLRMNVNLIRLGYIAYYAMSIWFFFKIVLKKKQSPFMKSLIFMFVLVIIYATILLITGTSGWRRQMETNTFLMVHLESMVPLFVFYYFGQSGKINSEWFSYISVFFVIDAYMLYYSNTTIQMESLLNADEGFINNTGYAWAALLPLIAFLNKRKTIQYLFIGLVVFFVLMCVKRGAIIITIIGTLYFLFKSMEKTSTSRRVSMLIFGAGLGIIFLNYFNSLVESNEFFAMRYEDTMEGNLSGRDRIFSYFFHYFFSEENAIHFFFGNGALGTVKILGIEAHNDWLEYAIDMGFLGVIAYAVYWINAAKNYSFYSKNGGDKYILMAMGMVLIMNFVRSFMSMSLDNMYFFTSAVLGYTMSMADSLRYNNRNYKVFTE